jgi:hypothetical protein
MPAAGYSVGRDTKLVFVDEASGNVVTWSILSSADFKPDFKQLQWKAIDGTNSFAEIPQGWIGTFTVDRAGPDLMDYAVANENDYFLGNTAATVYLQQTITNPDGSTSQYRFVNGAVKLVDAGKWSGDDKVTQTVAARFSRCLKVS